MKSSKIWSKNALPLIVGNFLMGLILSIPLIAGIIILFATIGEDMFYFVEGEPSDETLIGLGIFVIIFAIIAFFFNPFKQAALYTTYNEILVHNKEVSLKEFFSYGFKHYFKYLLAQLVSGAIFVPILSVLTLVPLFVVVPLMEGSEGESLLATFGYFGFLAIVYLFVIPLFIGSPFKLAHKDSIKESIFFPFTAFKKPGAAFKFIGWIALYLIVVNIVDQITFGLVSLFVAIFEGVIYMYAYELYLKYFAPKLYKKITEEEVNEIPSVENIEIENQEEAESLAEQQDYQKSLEVFDDKQEEKDSSEDKKE